MIGILPTPRPDEYLPGIVARYLHEHGYEGERVTPRAHGWLGVSSVSQHGACSVAEILSLGAYKSPVETAAALIGGHTWLQTATVCFSAATRSEILAGFATPHAPKREASASRLLRPPNVHLAAPGLRWCAQCADEDRKQFEKAHFRTAHQGAATAICLEHNSWLRTSDVERDRLVASPDDLKRTQSRPMGVGKISAVVKMCARVDQAWRYTDWRPALAHDLKEVISERVRRVLRQSFDAVVDEECLRDAFFRSNAWEGQRLSLWDAGLTTLAVLSRGQLARAVSQLALHDWPFVYLLAPCALLGVLPEAVLGREAWRARQKSLTPDALCGAPVCKSFVEHKFTRWSDEVRYRDGRAAALCATCGWRADWDGQRVNIVSFGSEMPRAAYLLARDTLMSPQDMAIRLHVSPQEFDRLWHRGEAAATKLPHMQSSLEGFRRHRAAKQRRQSRAAQTNPVAPRGWVLRPGLHANDPQFDAEAVTWSGPGIERKRRILEASEPLSLSEISEASGRPRLEICRRVAEGKVLALRRGRELFFPSWQFTAAAEVSAECRRIFAAAVRNQADPWDLAEAIHEFWEARPPETALLEIARNGSAPELELALIRVLGTVRALRQGP